MQFTLIWKAYLHMQSTVQTTAVLYTESYRPDFVYATSRTMMLPLQAYRAGWGDLCVQPRRLRAGLFTPAENSISRDMFTIGGGSVCAGGWSRALRTACSAGLCMRLCACALCDSCRAEDQAQIYYPILRTELSREYGLFRRRSV